MSGLPPGWTAAAIEDIAETGSGGTPLRNRADYFGGNIPWFKSGELNDSTLPTQSEERLTDEGLASSSAKQFPAGTILVAMYGATVGKIGILQSPATTNQAVCGIIPSHALDHKYLFFFLLSQRNDLLSKRIGGAQPNINQQVVRDLSVPLPPVAEQHRIVAEIEKQFTRLDEAGRILQIQRKKLIQYEGTVLNSYSHGMKWPMVPFRTLLAAPLRNGHSAKATQSDHGVRAITLSAITEGDFSESNTKLTSADPERVSDLWIEPNDFLFQRGNTAELVGLARLYRGPSRFAIFPDLVIRARTNESVNRDYLELVLHSPSTRRFIRSRAQGIAGSMPKIDQETIESIPIPLPEREQQDQIAERAVAGRSVLQRLRPEIDRCRHQASRLRQSILAKAFSGQLVPQDPNDEPASMLLDKIHAERVGNNSAQPKRNSRKKTAAKWE